MHLVFESTQLKQGSEQLSQVFGVSDLFKYVFGLQGSQIGMARAVFKKVSPEQVRHFLVVEK